MAGLECVSHNLSIEAQSLLTHHRLFIIGVTTAFLGTSNITRSAKPRRQESINYVSVAGNLFLSHRQSLEALLSSHGVKDSNSVASEALTNLSFDDDVENLLEHGW